MDAIRNASAPAGHVLSHVVLLASLGCGTGVLTYILLTDASSGTQSPRDRLIVAVAAGAATMLALAAIWLLFFLN